MLMGDVQTIPPHVVETIVNDNIELACQAIEKAAMERAIMDVDESLALSFDARRRYRDQRGGHPFWDPAVMQTSWPAALPDPLRLKATGLQPHQLVLYDDFGTTAEEYAARQALMAHPGQDMQRRLVSRPGSTVSYRQDSAAGNYSPAPDQQGFPIHPSNEDIVQRFMVCCFTLCPVDFV
jgi:CCR4-NOT transcription complex subunit 1